MIQFKKAFNLKIISIIVSAAFLFSSALYAYPAPKDSLRVQSGQEDTYKRIDRAIETHKEHNALGIDGNLSNAHKEQRIKPLHETDIGISAINSVHAYLEANGLGETISLFKGLQEKAQVDTPNWDKGGLWLVEAKKGEALPLEHASDRGGIHLVRFPGYTGHKRLAKAYAHGIAAYIGLTHKEAKIFEKAFYRWQVRGELTLSEGLKNKFIKMSKEREDNPYLLSQLSEKEKEGIYKRDYAAISRRKAMILVVLSPLAFISEKCSPDDIKPPPPTQEKTYDFIGTPLLPGDAAIKALDWIKGYQLYWDSFGNCVVKSYDGENIGWSFDQGTVMVVLSQLGHINSEYSHIAEKIAGFKVWEQGREKDDLWQDAYPVIGPSNAEHRNKKVGNIATVARGLVEVYLKKGNVEHLNSAEKAARAILDKFWKEIPGEDKGYFYGGIENTAEAKWVSTEHNARAGIFFLRLFDATRKYEYFEIARKIGNWIKDDMWAGDHFHVGYEASGNINTAYNQDLDAQLMPIIFLNMSPSFALNVFDTRGELDSVNFVTLEYIDRTYKKKISFKGTDGKYSEVELYGKVKGVNHIWPEGSANAAAVCEIWGGDFRQRRDQVLSDISKLQYVRGGIPAILAGKGSDSADAWPTHFPKAAVNSSVSFAAAALLEPKFFPIHKRSLAAIRRDLIIGPAIGSISNTNSSLKDLRAKIGELNKNRGLKTKDVDELKGLIDKLDLSAPELEEAKNTLESNLRTLKTKLRTEASEQHLAIIDNTLQEIEKVLNGISEFFSEIEAQRKKVEAVLYSDESIKRHFTINSYDAGSTDLKPLMQALWRLGWLDPDFTKTKAARGLSYDFKLIKDNIDIVTFSRDYASGKETRDKFMEEFKKLSEYGKKAVIIVEDEEEKKSMINLLKKDDYANARLDKDLFVIILAGYKEQQEINKLMDKNQSQLDLKKMTISDIVNNRKMIMELADEV